MGGGRVRVGGCPAGGGAGVVGPGRTPAPSPLQFSYIKLNTFEFIIPLVHSSTGLHYFLLRLLHDYKHSELLSFPW